MNFSVEHSPSVFKIRLDLPPPSEAFNEFI